MSSTIEIPSNKVFCWEKGLALMPKQRVIVLLPGALISETETIASVIEISKRHTRVEFIPFAGESEARGPAFNAIKIDLDPGTWMKLHKKTEAMVLSIAEAPIIFDVVE
jgi:hypothetical protein